MPGSSLHTMARSGPFYQNRTGPAFPHLGLEWRRLSRRAHRITPNESVLILVREPKQSCYRNTHLRWNFQYLTMDGLYLRGSNTSHSASSGHTSNTLLIRVYIHSPAIRQPEGERKPVPCIPNPGALPLFKNHMRHSAESIPMHHNIHIPLINPYQMQALFPPLQRKTNAVSHSLKTSPQPEHHRDYPTNCWDSDSPAPPA